MSQKVRIGNSYYHEGHDSEVVTTHHDDYNNVWYRIVISRDNAGVISTGDDIHQQPYSDFLGAVSMRDYPDDWNTLREAVLERDDYVAQCCGKDVNKSAPIHHICPLGCGGTNTLRNLITLCEEHHGKIHGGVI